MENGQDVGGLVGNLRAVNCDEAHIVGAGVEAKLTEPIRVHSRGVNRVRLGYLLLVEMDDGGMLIKG